MESERLAKVRVTIWQPYFAGFMLAIGRSEPSCLTILDRDAELQREAFTWAVEEDVWAGVVDDVKRTEFSSRFVNDFQPMLLPADRDMSKLGTYLTELNALAKSSESEWSICSYADEDSGSPPVINGLLAFHNQLTWLYDVFKDLPGASVSVR